MGFDSEVEEVIFGETGLLANAKAGMVLAEALGVDTETLRDALLDSNARNSAMEVRAETWELPWAEKDMSIVPKEADTARISLPLCSSVK